MGQGENGRNAEGRPFPCRWKVAIDHGSTKCMDVLFWSQEKINIKGARRPHLKARKISEVESSGQRNIPEGVLAISPTDTLSDGLRHIGDLGLHENPVDIDAETCVSVSGP